MLGDLRRPGAALCLTPPLRTGGNIREPQAEARPLQGLAGELGHPGEPLDAGSIKPDSFRQGFLSLDGGDSNIFWHPLDIRELKADKFDFVRLNFLKHLRYVC